jgi:hypothetical protein
VSPRRPANPDPMVARGPDLPLGARRRPRPRGTTRVGPGVSGLVRALSVRRSHPCLPGHCGPPRPSERGGAGSLLEATRPGPTDAGDRSPARQSRSRPPDFPGGHRRGSRGAAASRRGTASAVGLLSVGTDSAQPVPWQPFLDAMRELGYVKGQNLVPRASFRSRQGVGGIYVL